jgi:outer membrane protein
MNKKSLLLVFVGSILFVSSLFSQQKLKIGHANLVEILEALPQTDSAQQLIDKDTEELEGMLKEMQVEYNKLLDEYQQKLASYSEVIRAAKEADIVEMQNRIQTFQQNAAQQLQQRGAELMQPIYDKIQQAVEEIGQKEGYAYILDTSKGSVVFTGAASNDIGSLIREDLGFSDH